MDKERKWNTNKASFTRCGDWVKKSYSRVGDAYRDFQLLKEINEVFTPEEVSGWKYRTLAIQDSDFHHPVIVMEYFSGNSIKEIFEYKGDSKIFRHLGVWLGLLHNKSENEEGEVLAFNDFTRANVLIDEKNKEIVGIDPGNYTDVYVPPAVSLVMGAFSVERGGIRVGVLRTVKCLKWYFYGYERIRRGAPLYKMGHGVKELYLRIREGKSRTIFMSYRWMRKLLALGECGILSVLIVVSRLQARRMLRSREGRESKLGPEV